jgi:O-Antigen ligase
VTARGLGSSGPSVMTRSPGPGARREDIGKPLLLPEEQPPPRSLAIVTAAWFLIVLTVQPWVASERTLVGFASEGVSEIGKGLLTGAVFLWAAAMAAPRFRMMIPPTYGLYLTYMLLAVPAAVYSGRGSAFLLAVRLGMVLAIPALLWPWLTGNAEAFLRVHRRAHTVLAAVVLGGLLLGGSAAWEFGIPFGAGGRLQGVVPPMSAVRVGEVGAILAGLGLIAVVFGRIRPTFGLAGTLVGFGLIFLSHTRTAAGALIAGLVVASLSVARSRQGRWALTGVFLLLLVGTVFVNPLRSWVLREQSPEQFTTLTGRWAAWESLVQKELTPDEVVFGHGLGAKTITLEPNTLAQPWLEIQREKPIDNGWLSVFWESGVVGVVLISLALGAAFVFAWRAPTPYVRAACVFLLVLVLVASLLETGLSDTSSLTLHVFVASGAAYGDRVAARSRRPTADKGT